MLSASKNLIKSTTGRGDPQKLSFEQDCKLLNISLPVTLDELSKCYRKWQKHFGDLHTNLGDRDEDRQADYQAIREAYKRVEKTLKRQQKNYLTITDYHICAIDYFPKSGRSDESITFHFVEKNQRNAFAIFLSKQETDEDEYDIAPSRGKHDKTVQLRGNLEDFFALLAQNPVYRDTDFLNAYRARNMKKATEGLQTFVRAFYDTHSVYRPADFDDARAYLGQLAEKASGDEKKMYAQRQKNLEALIENVHRPREYTEKRRSNYFNNIVRWRETSDYNAPSNSHLILVEGDCLDLAGQLAKLFGITPFLLNMANAYEPGGGGTRGREAQEENLGRRTSLYDTFTADTVTRTMQTSGRGVVYSKWQYTKPMTGLLNGEEKVGYCYTDNPLICFKKGERDNYEDLLLHDVFGVYEIRLAALDLTHSRLTDWQKQQEIRRRIGVLVHTLTQNNAQWVILSAWGCGAFNNPVDMVAKLFVEQLLSLLANRNMYVFFAIDNQEHAAIFKKHFESIADNDWGVEVHTEGLAGFLARACLSGKHLLENTTSYQNFIQRVTHHFKDDLNPNTLKRLKADADSYDAKDEEKDKDWATCYHLADFHESTSQKKAKNGYLNVCVRQEKALEIAKRKSKVTLIHPTSLYHIGGGVLQGEASSEAEIMACTTALPNLMRHQYACYESLNQKNLLNKHNRLRYSTDLNSADALYLKEILVTRMPGEDGTFNKLDKDKRFSIRFLLSVDVDLPEDIDDLAELAYEAKLIEMIYNQLRIAIRSERTPIIILPKNNQHDWQLLAEIYRDMLSLPQFIGRLQLYFSAEDEAAFNVFSQVFKNELTMLDQAQCAAYHQLLGLPAPDKQRRTESKQEPRNSELLFSLINPAKGSLLYCLSKLHVTIDKKNQYIVLQFSTAKILNQFCLKCPDLGFRGENNNNMLFLSLDEIKQFKLRLMQYSAVYLRCFSDIWRHGADLARIVKADHKKAQARLTFYGSDSDSGEDPYHQSLGHVEDLDLKQGKQSGRALEDKSREKSWAP